MKHSFFTKEDDVNMILQENPFCFKGSMISENKMNCIMAYVAYFGYTSQSFSGVFSVVKTIEDGKINSKPLCLRAARKT